MWTLPIWAVKGHVRSKAISCDGHGELDHLLSLWDSQALVIILIRKAK